MNRPPTMFVRGDDLTLGRSSSPCSFLVDDRHALVVRGEAAPQVDGEHRLLDDDEGQPPSSGRAPSSTTGQVTPRRAAAISSALHGLPNGPAVGRRGLDPPTTWMPSAPQEHEGEEGGSACQRGGERSCERLAGTAVAGGSAGGGAGTKPPLMSGIVVDLVGVGVVGGCAWEPTTRSHAQPSVLPTVKAEAPVGPALADKPGGWPCVVSPPCPAG